jgi:hypothetical protein
MAMDVVSGRDEYDRKHSLCTSFEKNAKRSRCTQCEHRPVPWPEGLLRPSCGGFFFLFSSGSSQEELFLNFNNKQVTRQRQQTTGEKRKT